MGRPDKNQSYHEVLHVQPKPENLDRISPYHSMACFSYATIKNISLSQCVAVDNRLIHHCKYKVLWFILSESKTHSPEAVKTLE